VNDYILQTLARQRMDETTRMVRTAHPTLTSKGSSRSPRLRRWHIVRQPRLVRI